MYLYYCESNRVLVPPRLYSRSFSDPTRYRSADQMGRVAETPGRIEYPSIRVIRKLVEVSIHDCGYIGKRDCHRADIYRSGSKGTNTI